MHMQLRPHGLCVEFEMRHDRAGTGGRRGHVVVVLGDAGGGAVVENVAIFAQHEAVTTFAGFQTFPTIDVNTLEKLGCIAATNFNFIAAAFFWLAGNADAFLDSLGSGFTNQKIVRPTHISDDRLVNLVTTDPN